MYIHDSLLGLGGFLWLLGIWNDKVNSRVWLLEENSQLDFNLLGPERRGIRGTGTPREHADPKTRFLGQRNKPEQNPISLLWQKEY